MSTTNNCSNDFYSNIINYGSNYGPNNRLNKSPQLNNMGQIIAPYPATVRPQLFIIIHPLIITLLMVQKLIPIRCKIVIIIGF